MNKFIFQVGLVVFCVSLVVFDTGASSFMDAIEHAFVVFVVVVAVLGLGLYAVLSLIARQEEERVRSEQMARDAAEARERERSANAFGQTAA
jgi:divalent metal cation (Fe/Co/Zn/Cd) transporter